MQLQIMYSGSTLTKAMPQVRTTATKMLQGSMPYSEKALFALLAKLSTLLVKPPPSTSSHSSKSTSSHSSNSASSQSSKSTKALSIAAVPQEKKEIDWNTVSTPTNTFAPDSAPVKRLLDPPTQELPPRKVSSSLLAQASANPPQTVKTTSKNRESEAKITRGKIQTPMNHAWVKCRTLTRNVLQVNSIYHEGRL